MNNHWCAVCGHINRLGAEVCDMCDSRLDGSAQPGAESSGPSDFYGEGPRAGALPTDIPAPHFQGVGDVLAPTLEVYGKNFLLVVTLVLATTLLPSLMYAAFTYLMRSRMLDSGAGGGGELLSIYVIGPAVVGGAVYWILEMIGSAVLSGALAYAVIELQRTGAVRAADCLRWGLGKMLKVIGVTMICMIIYAAPFVVVAASTYFLGPIGFILFLLMILPWIVLMLTFSMAVPAAVVENRGVFESLSRSAELTKGFKGLIFLTYFLWWVLVIVLNLIISSSFSYAGGGSITGLVLQMLISGLLSSSTHVLTVYIFLGILKERGRGFGSPAYAPNPEDAAR
jgi:hypothetical protein